ncbi:outer membrane protein assembly factor BamC [Pantoea sp. 1.19]|uniref:outer membrane protein assembly factor BamC n=1 Tax=Pantoea sp. 1.19 TaxID=1925589 RepID=UPI0009490C2F|nr:outer membrane protein assembly factor BamC [Pantoea sp. 1.19]
MAYSVQKSALAKVVGLSLVMMLAACSNDQRYKRQVSGDESYLQATELQSLKVPGGMILPLQNGEYDVPPDRSQGAIGKQLDIRPPAQPLALMNGARTQFGGNTGTLLIDSGRGGSLWPQVVEAVKEANFPVADKQDASQTLTTDWVQWNRADEDNQYRGRYQIGVQQQGYQQSLTVKLLQLQQNGNDITDPAQLQRYNAQMLNTLSSRLTTLASARDSAGAQRSVGQIDVQSGADETGLPNLILRAPFNTVWQRLPAALNKIGMEVKDSSRNKGSLSVSYSAPGESGWDKLGAKDPGLDDGKYTLQVGDLDNRSSLQFIDSKGRPLSQTQNDALVAVMQAALN